MPEIRGKYPYNEYDLRIARQIWFDVWDPENAPHSCPPVKIVHTSEAEMHEIELNDPHRDAHKLSGDCWCQPDCHQFYDHGRTVWKHRRQPPAREDLHKLAVAWH